MSCAMSSTCFLRSAISASRMASWNWLWKSAAMLRMRRVHCPSVRRTAGSSFGPMKISATTPISRNSVQEMSNMGTSRPAHRSRIDRRPLAGREQPQATSGHLALDALLHVGRLMVDRLGGVGLGGVGGFLLRHAALEGFDALGDIAHHVRNLAPPAKDKQQDDADYQPVPDAQRAHEILRAQQRPRLI